MQRLGSNYFTTCNICGAAGHQKNECPLREHYHQQAVHAVIAGRGTAEDIREAMRPVAKREGLRT
jgi:hypothetical protein